MELTRNVQDSLDWNLHLGELEKNLIPEEITMLSGSNKILTSPEPFNFSANKNQMFTIGIEYRAH